MSKIHLSLPGSSQSDPKGEEIRLIQEFGFQKSTIEELRDKFKKFEVNKNGISINKYDLFDILKICGFKINEKLKIYVQKNLENRAIKKIDFLFVIECAGASKNIEKEINEEEKDSDEENAEYIDAFISMGGGPNTEGFIRKDTIINIIKNEFELTFDMADFLDDINSSSNELDFKAFCQLFEISNEDDNRSVTSKKSIISMLSGKGKRSNSFSVKYHDFLKFCENEKNNNLK